MLLLNLPGRLRAALLPFFSFFPPPLSSPPACARARCFTAAFFLLLYGDRDVLKRQRRRLCRVPNRRRVRLVDGERSRQPVALLSRLPDDNGAFQAGIWIRGFNVHTRIDRVDLRPVTRHPAAARG